MEKQRCVIAGLFIGLIVGFCLGAFPFIIYKGDTSGVPAIEPDQQHAFTPCTNWEIPVKAGEDPRKYDYNPSVKTCRGNITGPDYYRKAIKGCCKYKYGDVIP